MPRLPAERAVLAGLAPAEAAFALVEQQRSALRLVALSGLAAHEGLEAGMTLAEARAHVPDLVAVAHDGVADAALLARAGEAALDFSPQVELYPPASLTLDITGCDHLFGGEAAMAQALVARLGAGGLSARAALGDTADAARALARWQAPSVAALPLAALEAGDEATTALRRAGMRRLGDVAGLPRGALAARFGAGVMRALARLLGEEEAPFQPLAPAAPIHAERRFAEPVGREEDVLAAVGALVERAGQEMARRGIGGRRFALALHRSDGHVARMAIDTAAPTRDAALVLRLLRERIAALADPLDPGFGYDAITLSVPRHDPLAATQGALEDGPQAAAPLGELLDRLAVRHGAARVAQMVPGNSHVPERAAPMIAHGEASPALDWIAPAPDEPPARPLLLLDPPQRLEVLAGLPDGPPRRFRWQGQDHRVARAEGPERIAAEWWRRRTGHAEPPPARDYYRVEDEAGARFWVFRSGLLGRDGAPPPWYLHGLFA